MNKRNFILQFALKTKYNFFACLVALLVLIFSVSSLTYAWIEGATALKIKTSDTYPIKTVASTAKPAKVAATLDGDNTPTLELSQYIDPSECSLAPAKGVVSDKNVVVKFLKDGATDKSADASYRYADTNDISNNYIFFETKIKPNDDISSYKFKENSSIKIGDNVANSIKTAVTVLDAKRNPIESNIFTADQISTSQIACSALSKDTEYILQFRIWNEVTDTSYTTDNAGNEVAINFALVPQKQFTTLYLRDYTNDETNWKTLYSKKLKVEIGSKVIDGTKTDDSDYNTYRFDNVPSDTESLNNVKFVAYNNDETVYATWSLTGTPVPEQSTYCVYGGVKADKTGYGVMKTGETDPVKKVYLTDKSYENLMQNDKAVTLTSGSDSYVMYHASTDTKVFSAYTPVTSTNFIFNNGSYCVNDNMPSDTFFSASASPTYYILGETASKTYGKTNLAGIWRPASGSSDFHEITIKDRSVGRLVESLFETSGSSMFVSYPDSSYSTISNMPYKAAFNSTTKEWNIIATSTSYSQDGVLWTFSALDNNGDEKFKWAVEPRDSDSDTTYTFKSAVAVPGASDGTWGTYKISNMNPYILYENEQKLVSFYGGVPFDWTVNDNLLYIAENGTASATNFVLSSKIVSPNPKISSSEYKAAMFTDVKSFRYWLKHNASAVGWGGKLIPEAAQGGAFYYINNNGGYKVDKITGDTTLGGSNADNKNSPLQLVKGEVQLTTVTSSDKNMFGNTNLYIEYHMCPTGQENSANYYCLNPYVASSSTGTKVDSSKTTTTTIDFTDDSVAAFLNANGSDYTVKTVLTDGTVYYVADVDYVKFGETKTLTVNKCANADIVVTKDSTQIAEIKADSAEASVSASLFTGDEVVITATPKSSAAKFTWSVAAGGTSGEAVPADSTTLAASSTYTISSIEADTTVSLTADKYHKLTINKTENNTTGTVTVAGDTATLEDVTYVKDNTTPTLTATRDGSTPTRVQWETETPVDLTSTDNISTYTLPNAVTDDTAVNVTFTRLYKLTYSIVSTNVTDQTLTPNIEGASAATIDGDPVTVYVTNSSQAVTFTATRPNETGHFYKVVANVTKGDGTAKPADKNYSGDATIDVTMNGDTTVVVTETEVAAVTLKVDLETENSLYLTANCTDNSIGYSKDLFENLETTGEYKVPQGSVITVNSTAKSQFECAGFDVSGAEKLTDENSKVVFTVGDTNITVTAKATQVSTKRIYFQNNANWTEVKIHYFGGSSSSTWPGDAMTDCGNGLYSFDVPNGTTGVVFVGNIGENQKQTNKDSETIPDGKNLFNCKSSAESDGQYAGTWYKYPPDVTEYTVTINPVSDATIAVKLNDTDANISSGGKVPENTDITVTVTPNSSDYVVKSITITNKTTGNSDKTDYTADGAQTKTYTVASNVEITAVVEKKAETKRIYIDTSPCTWFVSQGYYPAIQYSGHTDLIYLKNQTETIGNKKYYYCDVPINVTNIYLARRNDSGKVYNSHIISDPTTSQNLFKVDSSWDSGSIYGTWSVLDTGGGDENNYTYYFVTKSDWSSYTVQYYNKWKSGTYTNSYHYGDMVDTGKTHNGQKIWSATFPKDDVFYNIAFKLMSGSEQKDYLEVYAGGGKALSEIKDKMYDASSGQWIDYTTD
ncbi:MAG: starch-binding protein [Acutalibacteraceae bacterium]